MASLRSILRRLRRSECGAEFIEFALAFPLLLLVVMGIVDFGLLFQQYEVITNAAREGARVAVLPNYNPQTDAAIRVNQYIAASFLTGGGTVSVNVTGPTAINIGANCMTLVKVTVTYPHTYLYLSGIAKYFGKTFGTKTLTASSTMRSEINGSACP